MRRFCGSFHVFIFVVIYVTVRLHATIDQLAKVEAIGHSEGSDAGARHLCQAHLLSMARWSVWSRVVALSGCGHPGMRHETSD